MVVVVVLLLPPTNHPKRFAFAKGVRKSSLEEERFIVVHQKIIPLLQRAAKQLLYIINSIERSDRIEAVKLGEFVPEDIFRVFVDELVLVRGHDFSKAEKLIV